MVKCHVPSLCCGFWTVAVAIVVGVTFYANNMSSIQFQKDESLLYGQMEFPTAFYKYSKATGGKNAKCVTSGKNEGAGCIDVNKPGPRTNTILDYAGVKAGLIDMISGLVSKKISRGDLFGMFWCYKGAFKGWPGDGNMPLGYGLENHAKIRVVSDEMWAPFPYNPKSATFEPWTTAGIRASIRAFLSVARQGSVMSTDKINTWVVQFLHEQEMNLKLSDEETKSFMKFQKMFIAETVVPGTVFLAEFLQAVGVASSDFLKQRDEWTAKYETALTQHWPDWTSAQVKSGAIACLTANVFAGGLSIGTVVTSTLAQLVLNNRVDAVTSTSTTSSSTATTASLQLAIWETLRLQPPAHATSVMKGTDTNLNTGSQIKYFLPTAMRDPSVYAVKTAGESTDVWNMDRPMLLADSVVEGYAPAAPRPSTKSEAIAWYAERNVAFADFATGVPVGDYDTATGRGLGKNPNAHYCPGKFMALAMIEGFITELRLGQQGGWTYTGGTGTGTGTGTENTNEKKIKAMNENKMPNGYQKGNYFKPFDLTRVKGLEL